ncbi:uncharacterized protein Gasu_11030 [Galdieria sulphuraria]|uniref:Chromosome segregation in meiosis protein 3 domain-containing protein n=1 Tax=Galdieria sulphuraria TaxID=130081 RepID=M2W7D2_GALSU|nr:uncharacterized protein Gasu_11030 [Galdieria sulphuraria]EME31726.1 hypothetical protein Gasu_11030 [Galdieria sulphuraria]|eukprot:XP_005708246.1 hypothetical protein Gasu_11030 [Galdieria sulphuraria]
MKEKRVLLNEELILNEQYGIPQLIRELETVQKNLKQESSIETIGKILETWQIWANKLSPNMEFGRFVSRLQALQSLRGIRTFLSDQRERLVVSNFEATKTDVPSDSGVFSDTPNSLRTRRDRNNMEENITSKQHSSDSFSDCFTQVDASTDIEPTQELDFPLEDSEQDI